jgi:hypothetical protein
MYCADVWGGALTSYSDELIKIQKKIVKLMVFASFNENTPPTFDNIYNYFLCIIHV